MEDRHTIIPDFRPKGNEDAGVPRQVGPLQRCPGWVNAALVVYVDPVAQQMRGCRARWAAHMARPGGLTLSHARMAKSPA
jgi:hypothetical protein